MKTGKALFSRWLYKLGTTVMSEPKNLKLEPQPTTKVFTGVHMLRPTIPILAACIAIPVMAQKTTIAPSAPTATETRTFALRNGGRLKIETVGNIKISAWDREEVALVINFRPGGNGDNSSIVVDSKNDSLSLITNYPRSLRNSNHTAAFSDMELKVPSRVSCDINSTIGEITLNGIEGNHKLRCGIGNIVINNVAGDILDISTLIGDINIELSFKPHDDFRAFVDHGNIILKAPWAKNIEVKRKEKSKIRRRKIININDGVKSVERTKERVQIITEIAKGNIGDGNGKMKLSTANGSIVMK